MRITELLRTEFFSKLMILTLSVVAKNEAEVFELRHKGETCSVN